MTWLTVTQNLYQRWRRICRNHNPVLSSFMTYHRVCSNLTRVTRRVPYVEQELLTHQEYLSSPPVISGVRVARSLVFCVMFCRSFFCPVLTTVLSDFSIYEIWLPLLYLQTFLSYIHAQLGNKTKVPGQMCSNTPLYKYGYN
jgi:hypothetical protein